MDKCVCGAPDPTPKAPGTNVYHDYECPVSALRRAAPDLLAACKRAQEFFQHTPGVDNVGLADCLTAAIAKAEGGKP